MDQGAQAVANWEPDADDTEIKFEQISHVCSQAIQKARLDKNLTQAQLAKKINEKPAVIHDLENGTSKYEPNVINSIEHALGVQIPRGRKKAKKPKKV
jgi:putative transcription factor